MLGVDPFRLALARRVLDELMPPMIAPALHGDWRTIAPEHNHALDRLAALGQCLVDRALERRGLPATPAAIGGDHESGAGILDAIAQR